MMNFQKFDSDDQKRWHLDKPKAESLGDFFSFIFNFTLVISLLAVVACILEKFIKSV